MAFESKTVDIFAVNAQLYDVKYPYTTFHGGLKRATTNFLFLLILYLGAVPENSPRFEI